MEAKIPRLQRVMHFKHVTRDTIGSFSEPRWIKYCLYLQQWLGLDGECHDVASDHQDLVNDNVEYNVTQPGQSNIPVRQYHPRSQSDLHAPTQVLSPVCIICRKIYQYVRVCYKATKHVLMQAETLTAEGEYIEKRCVQTVSKVGLSLRLSQ